MNRYTHSLPEELRQAAREAPDKPFIRTYVMLTSHFTVNTVSKFLSSFHVLVDPSRLIELFDHMLQPEIYREKSSLACLVKKFDPNLAATYAEELRGGVSWDFARHV